jgi:hypothetical protein
MRGEGEGLSTGFFRIKKAGRLRIGIGSALDEKYLLRIEGWTGKEGDDAILEAKLVRPLSDVECVHTDVGPERVPRSMALIAYAPFPLSGLFTRGGRPFWVRAWTDDYVELSIDASFPGAQRAHSPIHARERRSDPSSDRRAGRGDGRGMDSLPL